MTVIYEGRLAVMTKVDRNTDLVVEYVDKGAILNSRHALTNRKTQMTVKCLSAVTYYYLPIASMFKMAVIYPELQKQLSLAQKKARYDKLLDLNPIDIIETNFVVDEKYELPPHVRVSNEEMKRIPSLRMALKNAVMHYIITGRKDKGGSSLTKLLENNAENARKKMASQVQLQKEMSTMGLLDRLNTLNINKDRISDERFEKLKRFGSMIGKDTMITIQRDMNKLQNIVTNDLLPKLEEEVEGESELEFEEKPTSQPSWTVKNLRTDTETAPVIDMKWTRLLQDARSLIVTYDWGKFTLAMELDHPEQDCTHKRSNSDIGMLTQALRWKITLRQKMSAKCAGMRPPKS